MSEKFKEIYVYTDGAYSMKKDKGGCAFVIVDGGNMVYSHSEPSSGSTSNRMELQAAINALKYMRANDEYLKRRICIFSDSKYVVNGISSWVKRWIKHNWIKPSDGKPVMNRDLWEELYDLTYHPNSNAWFQWIKGHAGNKYNEIADELANEQAEIYGEEDYLPYTKYEKANLNNIALDKEFNRRLL